MDTMTIDSSSHGVVLFYNGITNVMGDGDGVFVAIAFGSVPPIVNVSI